MAFCHTLFSVNVIAKPRLRKFWTEYPPAQIPLTIWFKHMRRTRYQNTNELRAQFPSADLVGRYTVFNIGGNKYRLIVKMIYTSQKVYVNKVLTHKQYDLWTDEIRAKNRKSE
jgi:mRNA interferase HigB